MTENNLPFNSHEFKETWEEWLQYRKERRLPAYKPTGLKRTFAGLIRDSDNNEATAIKMIINSIEKNWQGIFKINTNGTYNTSNVGNGNNKVGTSEARINTAKNW